VTNEAEAIPRPMRHDYRNIRSRIWHAALVRTSSLSMICEPRARLSGGASNGMLSE